MTVGFCDFKYCFTPSPPNWQGVVTLSVCADVADMKIIKNVDLQHVIWNHLQRSCMYIMFIMCAPDVQCIFTFLLLAWCITSHYLTRGLREWSLQVAVTWLLNKLLRVLILYKQYLYRLIMLCKRQTNFPPVSVVGHRLAREFCYKIILPCQLCTQWCLESRWRKLFYEIFIAIVQWEFCLLTCRLIITHMLSY